MKVLSANICSSVFFFRKHILCLLFLSLISPASFSLDIIFHEGVVKEKISKRDLVAIYSARKRYWKDDQPIKVVIYKNHNKSHNDFCYDILGITPYKLKTIWKRVVFSALGRFPIYVESEEEMLQTVKSTPGAIGYLETIKDRGGVNVLSIK